MKNSLSELLARLTKEGVDFVVIGGFAGIIYGCTYVTQDTDICIDLSAENIGKIYNSTADLHPVHRMTPAKIPFTFDVNRPCRFQNLYLDTDLGQLDCLGEVKGVGEFSKVFASSMPVEVDGIKIRVLSIGGLIESKKAMNRPSDIQAVVQLEAIEKLRKEK